jgi:hypothetical protein
MLQGTFTHQTTTAEIQSFHDELIITRHQALLQVTDPDIQIRDMHPSGRFFLVQNSNMLAYVGHPNDTNGGNVRHEEGIAQVLIFDNETDGILVDKTCTSMDDLVLALDTMSRTMSGRSTPTF